MISNTINLIEQSLSEGFNIYYIEEFKNDTLRKLSTQAMDEGIDPKTLLDHGSGRRETKFSLLEVYFLSSEVKELEKRKDWFIANLEQPYFKSLFFCIDSIHLQGEKKIKLLASWGFNPDFIANENTFLEYNKELIGLSPLHHAKNKKIILALLENGSNVKQKMKLPINELYQELINQNIKQITKYEEFWHYYIQPLNQKGLIDEYWYDVHKTAFEQKKRSLNIQAIIEANSYLACYFGELNALEYAKLNQ
jgi:hypothetical protein